MYLRPLGYEGMICDTSIRTVRGAIEQWTTGTTSVPFGRAVVRLPSGKISLPTGAGQKVIGISVAHDDLGGSYANGINADPVYPPNSPIDVLTFGDIFVWCEAAIDAEAPLLFRSVAAAAPLDKVGRFGAAAGTGLEALTGLRTLQKITAAGIVPVSFNSP